MKSVKYLAIIIFLLAYSTICFSQSDSQIEIVPIKDGLYRITVDGGYLVNLVASIGEDGILLVDSGFSETAEALKAKLKTMSDKDIKYIINTHHHTDHIGGNAILGENAVIIGYEEIRKRLQTARFMMVGYAEPGYLQDITFEKGMTLYFNGDEIKILPFPGSHTSNDSIVIFTKAKVACLGDIAYGMHFPSWGVLQGNTHKYPIIVKEILKILPKDVTVISGHGKNCSYDDMVNFQKMLEETVNKVVAELKKGRSVKSLQDEDFLKDYAEFEGPYVSRNYWLYGIDYYYRNQHPMLNPLDPLYKTYQEKGVDAMLEEFKDLKQNHSDKYYFGSIYLRIFGNFLIKKGKVDEGIKVLEFNVKQYDYSWIEFYYIAITYQELNYKAEAIKNFKTALGFKPGDPAVISDINERLKELEK